VSNPVNRFEAIHIEDDFEHLCDSDDLPRRPKLQTTYLNDQSETIVSENKSPDLGFRYSLNPYRGCSHGCSYCYARPSHEYLVPVPKVLLLCKFGLDAVLGVREDLYFLPLRPMRCGTERD
jgi:radical SAM superfamily enzyme YgiQ (UPF0313 family)